MLIIRKSKEPSHINGVTRDELPVLTFTLTRVLICLNTSAPVLPPCVLTITNLSLPWFITSNRPIKISQGHLKFALLWKPSVLPWMYHSHTDSYRFQGLIFPDGPAGVQTPPFRLESPLSTTHILHAHLISRFTTSLRMHLTSSWPTLDMGPLPKISLHTHKFFCQTSRKHFF